MKSIGDDIASAFSQYEPYGEVHPNWWNDLERLRRRCPVVHSERCGGFWLVSRYVDVQTVFQNPDVFSSTDGITIPHHPDAPVQPPLDADPPLHTDFRRLLNPHFTAAAVQPQAPVVAELARSLIGRFAQDGQCEFLSAFARPLPAMVLGRLVLGIDDLDALLALQARVTIIASQNTSEEAAAAWQDLRSYVEVLIDEAGGRAPDGGIISDLAHGTVAGRPVSRHEQVGALTVLILGGLGTTADALAMIVLRLADDTSLEDRLREPDWVSSYLDELLRIDSPVQWLGRTVVQPYKLSGVDLSPGERVMVHVGSANRDELFFDHADAVDFARHDQRHLAFGFGAHYCIGSHLAKLVIGVGLSALLGQVTRIDRDRTVPVSMRDGTSRPMLELPISFKPHPPLSGSRSR